ncbi:MAG TPA: hypothetical protein PLV45_14585 [bacterium]|nr:hypothetical protein [bacterium]
MKKLNLMTPLLESVLSRVSRADTHREPEIMDVETDSVHYS